MQSVATAQQVELQPGVVAREQVALLWLEQPSQLATQPPLRLPRRWSAEVKAVAPHRDFSTP
jgi:hypothetical protein